ncbi:hypothetical protein FRB94_012358 [Tulasnella sp. JGI-2019a]|nr:hypothetical protein FRB94_012358 [Tulasnella sp. JGI-2019a]
MLDTIQSVYASTSTQTLVYLQSKLLLMKMKEKDGLCSFVSKFHKVRVQICNIDTNYPEIAMAVMLLNALLRLYDGLKSTLNAQPKNLTLNTLQQQLLHEDMTCQSSDAITPKEEIQAFQAQDLVLVSSCQREEAPEVDKVEVVVVAVAEVKEEETEVMVEMEVEDKEVVLVEANISNVTPTNGSTQFILDSSPLTICVATMNISQTLTLQTTQLKLQLPMAQPSKQPELVISASIWSSQTVPPLKESSQTSFMSLA